MGEEVRRALVPAALGVAQIVAWGTLYYASVVLGPPIGDELQLSMLELHGGLTAGLAVAGVLAPAVGRACDRVGARAVLVSSAVVGPLGLALLACAHGSVTFFASWIVIGGAMALGLYDPVFAALATRDSTEHRRRIGVVAILGGLASTVAWPVTHALVGPLGWRATLVVLALALAACGPLYYAIVPRSREAKSAPPEPRSTRAPMLWIGIAFTASTLVMTAASVHLLGILEHTGLDASDAVMVAAAMGVMQSIGRLADATLGPRLSTWSLGAIALGSCAVALSGLALAPASMATGIAFVIAFGAAAGVLTVVRGALPVQMVGAARAGTILGVIAAPTSAARALGPFVFAIAAASEIGVHGALAATAGVAWLALASYRLAWSRSGAGASSGSAAHLEVVAR